MADRSNKYATIFSKVILIPAIIIIILVLVAVTRETYKKNQIQNEIDILREKAKQINKENLEIQEKITYFESKEYQEKEAKDKLSLQNPDENVVIIKPGIAKENKIEEKIPAFVPKEEQEIYNPIKWWRYFFKY
ncbi:MAG: septum formation initiator family protein [Patescibacteria group bacterium]